MNCVHDLSRKEAFYFILETQGFGVLSEYEFRRQAGIA